MYTVKVYNKEHLFDVMHYNAFQNALADISNKKVFETIPKELIDSLGNPGIYYGSWDEENDIADDFEFRYENGVTAYVGETYTVDSLRRKENIIYE